MPPCLPRARLGCVSELSIRLTRAARALAVLWILFLGLLFGAPGPAAATPFTMTTPNGIALPTAYPQAGGVAMVMVGVNGNTYYQFSDPTGAFVGFQNNGNPAAFRGNPFTINNPITLNCGNTTCATYFGGAIATMYVRFSAQDGDTSAGDFDFNNIDLVMNGFTVGNWSAQTTQITNTAGTVSSGTVTGFSNNTFNTGWFTTTNSALLSNILSTGRTTTQVRDSDPNDNFWDFTIGNSLANPLLRTVAPGYDLIKTASTQTYATVGQLVTYTYVIRNIGSVRITNLAISDDRLTGITCNKTTILATNLGATPDQATCTGTYTITQADIDSGTVTNNAVGTGTPDFGVLGQVTATRTITGPAQSPGLTMTKTASIANFGAVGSSVPYTFTFRNGGNVTLTNVTVTDPKIPSLSCVVASLPPGQQRVCTANYTVTQADLDAWATGTQLANTATVSGTRPGGAGTVSATANRSLPGPAIGPALTVTKTSNPNGFATAGTVLNFTVAVQNTGNVTFPAAPAVSDPLVTGGGGSVTCPAGPVAPGATITCTAAYTVTQADVDAGTLRNTASASITVGGVAATNSGFVDVTGTRTPSLTIDKQQAAGAPASFNAPGVGLTYIYIVRNTGNVTFNAPTVADDRVAVTCPAGTIAPNTSVTCTSAVYTTTQADVNAGGVTNTATATAAPVGGGAAVTSPSDSVTVPSIRNPAMTVAKSAPNLPAAQFVVGNTVTYSYTVTNTGNVGLAQQVTITDDKIGAPFNCGTPGLVPGQSLTCTATYAFTLADVAAGFVTNRAFGTSGTTTSNTDTVTVPQSGTPDIAVAKTATTASFTTLGQTIDYSFTITNSGQTTITQAGQPVTLNDPKLTTNNCAAQQPVQLVAGASFTCTGSYTGVTQAEMDAGQVVNTATASFVFNGGGGPVTVTSPTSTATVPSAAAPAVTVAKSAVPAQFTTVGQTITYTFTITNTGLQTLATATVTDPLIPSLSCTRTNIAPAGTANCTGTYAVTQADMDAGVVNNTATVDALTPANVPATNAGSTTVPVAPGSATKSMTLAKTANPSPFAAVGSTVVYTFAVTNTGTQTLTGITVTDPLIPSFTCNIATLAPGAVNNTCTANYTVTQADVNAGSRANTATATAPGAANATSTITTPGPARAPSLTLAKAGPASFTAAGQNVVYTFTVRNTGNVTLTGVTVTDPLVPAFTCTIPTLAPGASSSTCQATYVATQADVDAGQIVNTGSVSATPPGGGPVTATGADTTPGPTRAPALTMTKAGPASFTGPGQTISYAFTVRNTGNVTLTGITVTDPLIPSFTCTIPTLSPGATDTSCSTTYLTTQADVNAGSIVNSAAASATAPGGGSASTTATDTTPGPARTPAISMAKSAVAPVPVITMPGQTVSYQYVVTNSGNITLTAPVAISDNRIASVSCPALPPGGLAPAATLTCTASYAATQADIDAGSIVNTATASVTQTIAGQPTPVTVTSTDSETVPTSQAPSLDLAKAVTTGTPSAYAAVGDALSYTFTVSNTGNTTITGPVSVNDPLIQPPFTCAAGPLAVGAAASCTATYTVTQADIDAGSVANTARAFTGPVGAPTLQSSPSSATAFAQQSPALSVVKSTTQMAATDFTLGNTITYSYLVTNSGNVSIPAPVTVADNYATTSCPSGGLAPGATLTCTGTYAIAANDLALGSVTNNATANAVFNGNPVVSNTGSVTIPGGVSPALTTTKAASGGPITGVGQVLTYTYTVTNTGDAAFASDVSVIDDKVAGPILCHDSQGGTVPLNPVATGPAPTGATCTATYTTVQADVDAGFVTNTAFAEAVYAPLSPNPQTVQSPAVTATVGATPNPALTVGKAVTAGPNPAAAGDVLTYAVTTTNTGNQTVSVITVTDPLIPVLSCTIGGNPAPANIVLAPAQVLICTGSYTVTQADVDAQALGNTATVTGVSPQGTPVSVTGSTTHPVAAAAAAVSVVKSVISPTTNPVYSSVGEQIVFGAAVTNSGNTTLSSATVTDPLVAPQTCTVGPLAPGATDNSCTFTYTVTQTDIDAGSIVNTATATAQPATPGAPTVTGQGSVTAAGPVAAPSFIVAKTADVTAISAAGQVVTYTYVVTNASNVTIRGVPSVTDNRIGTFSCGTAPIAPGAQTQCTATYTVTQADLNSGGVTNIATAQAPAVPAGGGFPASPAVPPSAPVALTLPTASAPGLTLAKTVVSQTELFPTVWQATFQIDALNSGNLSLTNLDIQDDLAAFAAPGTLLTTPPVSVTLSGFTDSNGVPTGSLNGGFNGTTNTALLAAGSSLDPGRPGQLLITFTYSAANGFPQGTNTVTATSPILAGPVSATATALIVDQDGDGIVDGVESCTTDRDGDGICDAQDYDPTGYFYCEDDGAILIGGSISVTGPAGTQTGVGTSNNITIVADGSTGAYQFFVSAPGIYTITPTYPTSGIASTTRVPTSVPIDLTAFLPTDPVAFGSTEFGSTGVLADFTAAANTPSHLVFDVQAGDPHVIGNNFALTGCAGVAPITASKTASVGSARPGDSVTFTMTFINGTSASGNNSTFVDLLPPGLVYTPGTATVNGVPTEPVIAGNRLSWSSYNLTPGLTFTVVLTTRVLGTATFGTLTNTGFVEDAFGSRVSNAATATVRIEPEHVFDCSDVIGKVFDDLNMNGYQDQGEPGLPDVRVVTIRGVRITSDEYGRYHVPCAELPSDIGSNFTLKLDTRTLPSGYRVTTENPRTIRLTAGKMAKLNFGAAIANVVDIDLSASAFESGTDDPKAALEQGVEALVRQMSAKPSVIRLSYIQDGEPRKTVTARLDAVEDLLREEWRANGRYKLNIERTIKRVQ